jgi:glucan 1,3-beta-glucosidase
VCKQELKVIISDSYRPNKWLRFMQPPTYHNVVLDTHLYQGYSPADKRAGLDYHFNKAQAQKAKILSWQRYKPVIVGEWSLGSGRSTFAIPDKTKKQDLQRHYAKTQIESYDHAAAWFFWSYKIEAKNNWNFRHLVESGIIKLPNSDMMS